MHIDSYSFGSMTVDGKTYSSDIIVFGDRVTSSWWRAEGHSLCTEDLEEVLEYKPEILVVGRGSAGVMEVPQATREAIKAEGIEIIDSTTGEAVQIFNEKIKKGVKAVGAFHLTC